MMLSWKMAACIGAGNTVVLKPAQVCPLTALKFAELSVLAGFPNGVINILPGTGTITGQAIADHPLVRKLGFTGSTEIGKTIMTSCAKSNLKKCSLELGGKSPLVIFADCDLDKAVKYVICLLIYSNFLLDFFLYRHLITFSIRKSIFRACHQYSLTRAKIA